MRGVRQKVHRVGARALRHVEYSPLMPPHCCSKGHIGHVLDGSIEIEFRDGTERFGTGDALFIPNGPEHEHRARALTPTVTALFVEEA